MAQPVKEDEEVELDDPDPDVPEHVGRAKGQKSGVSVLEKGRAGALDAVAYRRDGVDVLYAHLGQHRDGAHDGQGEEHEPVVDEELTKYGPADVGAEAEGEGAEGEACPYDGLGDY